MPLIAALGMYDRAQTMGANDKLWALMRDGLRDLAQDAPDELSRGDLAYMQGWLSPDLLFSQTCSLPFRTKLVGRVNLIATPDYGLEGCPAGHYRSVYVARRDDGFTSLEDVAGLDFAYNEALSHSGWAAPYADHLARGLTLSPTLCTGAHRASAIALATGRADYAAIDALSWAMICAHDDFANKLCVIGHTPPSPALPYITAKDPAPLRAALTQAIAALTAADRAALHLRGLVGIPEAAYLSLPIPPAPTAG
jgi:ABC-type phosphate/phosphonate transport system substrate-binding protein